MGWQNEDAPGHEGYLIGLEPAPQDPGTWRELRYPDDKDRTLPSVEMFQVGCDCGWRSPRFRAPLGTSWAPFFLELPYPYDDSLRSVAAELWGQHYRMPDALAARAEQRVPRAPAPTTSRDKDDRRGGRLELAEDAGGPRHFLLGEAVHAGTGLELLLADGRWIPGRYEFTRHDDDLRPLFYADLPLATAAPDWAGADADAAVHPEACIELPAAARLRWPRP
jgi:hypothetical protein